MENQPDSGLSGGVPKDSRLLRAGQERLLILSLKTTVCFTFPEMLRDKRG